MKLHKRLASALVATMVLTSMPVATMANDYESHWASEAISKWTNKKVVEGFEDGTFRPSETITKAQFAKILVELMGYNTTEGSSTYTDVAEDKWYSDYVTKISAADVMHETGSTFNPNSGITREEAAYALVNAYKLDNSGVEKASFTDEIAISEWAVENVKTLYNAGYIKGNPDGSFNPKGTLTRAELITMIDRMNSDVVNTKGEYSSNVSGNLVVNTTGVTLKDMTIDGDLYLAEGIGKGDVKMENVTVNGRVIVEGGGVNSIKANKKCKFNGAFLVYAKSPVRIIIEGDKVDVYVMAGTEVVLTGKYDSIKVGAGAKVILDDATVETITADEAGKAPVIEIKSNSRVEKVVADVRVTIQGNGKLVELVANAVGTSSSIKPDRTSGSEKPSISNTSNNGWNSGFNDHDDDTSSTNRPTDPSGPTEQKEEYTVTVVNEDGYTGEITLNNGTKVTNGTKLSLTATEAKAITSATVDTRFKATVTLEGKTIKVTVTKVQTPGQDKETVTYPVRFVKADNENEAVTTSGTITVVVDGQDAPITVEVDNASKAEFKVEHQAGTQIKITSIKFTNKENTLTVDGVVDGTQGYKFVIPGEQGGTTDPTELVEYTVTANGLDEGTQLIFNDQEVKNNTITAKPADIIETNFKAEGYKVVAGSLKVTTNADGKTGTIEIKFVKDETPVTDFTYTIVNTGVTTNGAITVKINDGNEIETTDVEGSKQVTLTEELTGTDTVVVVVDGKEFKATVDLEKKEISYEYQVSDFQYTVKAAEDGDPIPAGLDVILTIDGGEPITLGSANETLTFTEEIPADAVIKVTVGTVECEVTRVENTITYKYVAPVTDTLVIDEVTIKYAKEAEQPTEVLSWLMRGSNAKALKINGVEANYDATNDKLVCDTEIGTTVDAELTYKLAEGGTVTFIAKDVPVSNKTISLAFTKVSKDVTGTVSYTVGDVVTGASLANATTATLTIDGEEVTVEGTTFNFADETELVDLVALPDPVNATLDVTYTDEAGNERTAKFTTEAAQYKFDPETGKVNYVIGNADTFAFDPTEVDAEGVATGTTVLTEANLFGTIAILDKEDNNILTAENVVKLQKGLTSKDVKLEETNGVLNYIVEESLPFSELSGYKILVGGPNGEVLAEGVEFIEIPLNKTEFTAALADLSVNGGLLNVMQLSPQEDPVDVTDATQLGDLDTAVANALGEDATNADLTTAKYGELTLVDPSGAPKGRSVTTNGAVQVTTTTPGSIQVTGSTTHTTPNKMPAPSFKGAFAQIVYEAKYSMTVTFKNKTEDADDIVITIYVTVQPKGTGFKFSAE